MRAPGVPLALLLLSVLGSFCGRPRGPRAEAEPRHEWRQAYGDSNYQVSVDTAHIERAPEGAYLVWLETKHASLQTEFGKPWNREIIRSLLRCAPLSFKTVRVTLQYNDGPVIAAEGGDVASVADRPWKPVIPRSVDEARMSGACALISRAGKMPVAGRTSSAPVPPEVRPNWRLRL